jgi:ribose transport system permease protein
VPAGRAGAEALAAELARTAPKGSSILVVAETGGDGPEFATTLSPILAEGGFRVLGVVVGDPPAVRQALEQTVASEGGIDLVATTQGCASWAVFDNARARIPALQHLQVRSAPTVRRSAFLSPSNLRNIADQIAVIAILAAGMTLVIVTGGIDLSVGSLIALSAVVTAWLIQRAGGANASPLAMIGCCLLAIALCGAVGAFSGLTITRCNIPPFIATLAMMQVASGLAFIIAHGESIYDIPASFTWLGRGTTASAPNAVLTMLLIYAGAHLLMSRTAIGRHIYAVGGNAEAARLSGVRTRRVLLFAYVAAGLMAGLGGVITASQLKAGAPTYGAMYELYVIAAVVVGGTSLSGGEGAIPGTLVGAFIIAVIRNGMNLIGVAPYTQKIVLGLVILGAVLLDMLKRRGEKRG